MDLKISERAKLPTKYGDFLIQSFQENREYTKDHLVVFSQKLGNVPLVRLHSECLTGDVFGSLKCDCGTELEYAMKEIVKSKDGGMLIYLRQEGRGIGLFNKVNAYALQDKGRDTIEANLELGFPSDLRDYEIVGEIFRYFGIGEINLLTNNPLKIESIQKYVKVSRTSIIVGCNKHNKDYLQVKKDKMGHLL
ncbi:MAG: GTP cyclohydrolase II [Helicobacter sp.]|uniref:GTP cyclohydrolase II n=1 Tax=Helicobacter sp. 10-6591 TaxID=2004998 RepID=UPI000DCB5624|nr:GTP cyclohydrolase II [Helicobacter sp. 10-6591]MCI6218109.1 GTP cyclohydrolase II [Helicobacter sp.]MCI7485161.1 GTP cyclohydrolase II [Helicobacter sp.]MDD7566904.1 GTP cyclohydrolase II [Helicobacter sp.]MDY5740715.1 GTP cyclohydrolase II [Helicobacter sp.]RAX53937.1 GTP cyclohydrolase II [Helicobacter sp. 10-6591]